MKINSSFNKLKFNNPRKLSQKASRKDSIKDISEKKNKISNISKVSKENKEKKGKGIFNEDKQDKKNQKLSENNKISERKKDNAFELSDFDDISNIPIFIGTGTAAAAAGTFTQEIEEILGVPLRNTRVQGTGREYLPSRTQETEKIEDQVRYQTSASSAYSSSSAVYSGRENEFYSSTSSSSGREDYSSTLSDYDNKSDYSNAFKRLATERELREDEISQDRPRTFDSDFNSEFQGKSKIEEHYESRARGERRLTVDEALGLETPFQELSRPEEARKYRGKKIMR